MVKVCRKGILPTGWIGSRTSGPFTGGSVTGVARPNLSGGISRLLPLHGC